ncbi:MAG: ribulose-phosphate 3-epimerase [Rickettsiales bacterium]|nr:MAG: ribulose-phosphate 3-epimerase [Rickettsiales bacterium]
MILISPSLLSANFLNLEKEIILLQDSGADMLHLDIMDGHFVPNLTFGSDMVKAIKDKTKLPLDVHLMINQPENWLKHYANSGADIITIHPESTKHLSRTISQIKELGIKAGVALLPTTNTDILEYILDQIDLILVMSVNPGFGGQKFMDNQLPKIAKLANIILNKNIILAVDGGINNETAKLCVANGANMLISGNYIFSGNYQERIDNLKQAKI